MKEVREIIEECCEIARGAGAEVDVLLEMPEGDLVGISRKGAEGGKCVYISSGMHGDEPAGVYALRDLLREGLLDQWPDVHWMICPVINPRGHAVGTRETPEGQDLNRDYYQCRSPEVCAHISWLKGQPTPDLFFSLHEDWESTGIYLYEINVDDRRSIAMELIARAGQYFPPEPELVIDDHEVRERGWIYHGAEPDMEDGWPEAIWVAKSGCPLSYTIETPSSMGLEERVECQKAMVREALALSLGG